MNISDYIANGMLLCESLESKTLAGLFGNDAFRKSWLYKQIKNELTWDKITDDDIEGMTPEEALKMIYKHSGSPEYILWLNIDNDVPAMRSIGIKGITNMVGESGSVKTMLRRIRTSEDAVYVIKDWEKFSTNALRNKRREQKMGALALKSADELLAGHNLKMKEMMAEYVGKKYLHMDMSKYFEDITEAFSHYITNAKLSEDFLSSTRAWSTKLDELIQDYEMLLNELRRVISDQEGLQQREGDEEGGINKFFMQTFVSKCKDFEKKMRNFFSKWDILDTEE